MIARVGGPLSVGLFPIPAVNTAITTPIRAAKALAIPAAASSRSSERRERVSARERHS